MKGSLSFRKSRSDRGNDLVCLPDDDRIARMVVAASRRGDLARLKSLLRDLPGSSEDLYTFNPNFYVEGDPLCRSPLHFAALLSRGTAAAEFLVSKNAFVDCVDAEGRTPLHLAAYQGNVQLVSGAKVEHGDEKGLRTIHIAVQGRNPDVVHALLDWGANLDVQDEEGRTPLYCAVFYGNIQAVRILMSFYPNMRGAFDSGKIDYLPFNWACYFNYFDIVAMFIEAGYNCCLSDRRGWGALHWTVFGCESGRRDEIEARIGLLNCLLNRGCVVELQDGKSRTALAWAVLLGHLEISQFLVEQGSDVNCPNVGGDTPLHEAVRMNRVLIFDYLLEKGADPEKENFNAVSSSHLAFFLEQREIMNSILIYRLKERQRRGSSYGYVPGGKRKKKPVFSGGSNNWPSFTVVLDLISGPEYSLFTEKRELHDTESRERQQQHAPRLRLTHNSASESVASAVASSSVESVVKSAATSSAPRPCNRECRFAFVAGTGRYINHNPLDAAVRDAQEMKEVLKRLDFDVIYVEDADCETLTKELRKFHETLESHAVGRKCFLELGDHEHVRDIISLFYFSGHGTMRGEHQYFLPVDFSNPALDADADETAMEVSAVSSDWNMKACRRHSTLTIHIIDACRDQSSASPGVRLVNASNTRKTIASPRERDRHEMYTAWAAAQGKIAYNKEGETYSFFTKHLLEKLRNIADIKEKAKAEGRQAGDSDGVPELDEVFRDVRSAVGNETEDRQRTNTHHEMLGKWYF